MAKEVMKMAITEKVFNSQGESEYPVLSLIILRMNDHGVRALKGKSVSLFSYLSLSWQCTYNILSLKSCCSSSESFVYDFVFYVICFPGIGPQL